MKSDAKCECAMRNVIFFSELIVFIPGNHTDRIIIDTRCKIRHSGVWNIRQSGARATPRDGLPHFVIIDELFAKMKIALDFVIGIIIC